MQTRPARSSDYDDFARLFLELETGDPVPPESRWNDELAPKTLVLEEAGRLIGYIYFQTFDGTGYVRNVVVDPKYRGRGLGRRLMAEVRQRLVDAGATTWCLNVKPENRAAVNLYESLGMKLAYASCASRMGWEIIERLPAPGSETKVGELAPAQDRCAQSQFALPAGMLEQSRAKQWRVFGARRRQALTGLAVFAPSFPGVYPFKAEDPATARALLAAMRPLADPSFDYVQVVFEDAPDMVEVFDAAGARRHLEFVHYEGTLG